MKRRFEGWAAVAARLRERAALESEVSAQRGDSAAYLNAGQRASLTAIADRIERNGVVIADEVGMGKTRIAVVFARCVTESGGRVAILVPPGLGYQWKAELKSGGIDAPDLLRSMGGFLEAWQRDKPQSWFEQPVVLISHVFANWHMGASSQPWRWSLLPHTIAHWRKSQGKSWPDHYNDPQAPHAPGERNRAARSAAGEIVDATLTRRLPARRALEAIDALVHWPRSLEGPNYGLHGPLREALRRVVGIGLGRFDLVLLDEAHKSRGDESGLSRLLNQILLCDPDSRRVALTATPVELEVQQWRGTLERIGVQGQSLDKVVSVAEEYADALRKIRAGWRSSAEIRERFQAAAMRFEATLSPYVLRRDKREDPAVLAFGRRTGQGLHDYRDETREIAIEPQDLSPAWRQAVCAAEALSFVARGDDGRRFKQLRLTISHGQGMSGFVDGGDVADVALAMNSLEAASEVLDDPAATSHTESRRLARLRWWLAVVARTGDPQRHPLFEHPAIAQAVRAVEGANREGEKVLVFGRFTAPMQALVDLLNARELLRQVDGNHVVAQSKIHDSQSRAIDAAYRQWALEHQAPFRIARNDLDEVLKQNYEAEHRRLERSRAGLTRVLREGVSLLQAGAQGAIGNRHRLALEAFCDTAEATGDYDASGLVLLHRALMEAVGGLEANRTPVMLARAFIDLLEAAADMDASEAEPGEVDELSDGAQTWEAVVERLAEEYDRPQGSFARLMFGATSQVSRRMIQQAFNRVHGHPAVLVAQSLVGREGLNLHGACRIVVLLHPEWNPAVVEQQIGRVDRVGSHWARQVEAAPHLPGDQLPRIEIRPVIFRGTYGEHNWNVLRGRWDDLRAQLHGMVIPPRFALDLQGKEDAALLQEVMAMAPNFSPLAGVPAQPGDRNANVEQPS